MTTVANGKDAAIARGAGAVTATASEKDATGAGAETAVASEKDAASA